MNHPRPFQIEKARDRRKFVRPTAPRWNHQKELEQHKGKSISLWFDSFNSNDFIKSTLIDADAYTIHTKDGVFFKHAIRSYTLD